MDIKSETKRFLKDWDIDFGQKIIYRKKASIIQRLLEVLYSPKYPVIALYGFSQFHLATEAGIVYPNFIERIKGNEIADVPSWFEISEEWNIPEKDTKYLYLGPLVKGTEILVSALPKNGFFITIWQLISFISTVGGAITFIFWLLSGN